MEEQADYWVPERSTASKIVGDKRGCDELGAGDQELTCRRVKMKNLDSMLTAKGGDSSQIERSVTTSLTRSAEVNHVPGQLDLNSEACIGRVHNKSMMMSQGVCLDLNSEDMASSVVNSDRFYPSKSKKSRQKQSDNVSECASAIGGSPMVVVDKDPLKVWKEMKQNGFLSSPHGGISSHSNLVSNSSSSQGLHAPHGGVPVPKQRGRKPKNDTMKRRMELAKKEQVDRFTKIAAPSGLLNDLNPGIIYHVRNSRQVRSIIESLVKSEKLDNSRTESQRAGSKEPAGMMTSSHGYDSNLFSSGNECSAAVFGSKQMRAGFEVSSREGNSSTVGEIPGESTLSYSRPVEENDNTPPFVNLSSSVKVSGESSSVSNNESTDVTNASSLSVKAASVASQWLELLQQDIKGRLTALRRSKKRVRDVITTDLPLLVSKEFGSSNQENDPHAAAFPPVSLNATAAMHQARWTQLFDQMDKALAEEQRQLESWLNQLKEMQLHCDQGLQHFQWNAIVGFQPPGMPEHYRIPKPDSSEKELAVRAAAASIYSTCNFLTSKENVSCF